ncbi:unnamed protein product [Wuchereria bancrofti]|nr:unnamed protein product [Wuchereria bancrofti]
MEVYGNQSKCFDLATFWTERKCGRIRTFLQYKAGCYQYECSEGRLNIGLFNESFFYPCYFTGQYIYIRKIINGWLREGVIICPPCEEICHSEHFSVDDKFGYCQETNKDEIPEYVGDVLLDEPCAASTCYSLIFFLFIFLIRFSYNFGYST